MAQPDGICFSFNVALVGDEGVGKTTLAKMWHAIPSFDKLINGAEAPAVAEDLTPTRFVEYILLDVVVRNCADAAAHRVFILDTPGEERHHCLRTGLIQKNSLRGGTDGVIILVDTTKQDPSEAEAKEAELMSLVETCLGNKTFVLVIHRGSPPPPELLRIPDVMVVATANLEEGIVDETRALIELVERMHARKVWLRDEAHKVEEQLREQIAKAGSIKHARPLPTRKFDYQTSPGLSDDAKKSLNVALYGAENTGKSTFMATLLEGFALHDYDPTPRLECGTMTLEMPPDQKVNITVYDGPGIQKVPRVALGIVFVDVSHPFALEAAASALDDVEAPPMFVVFSTKSDEQSLVNFDELDAFAGELNAPLKEIDPRKNNEPLFVNLIAAMLEEERIVEKKIQRQAITFDATSRAKDIDVPHTEEDMLNLFNSYDLDGNGFIDLKEAERMYREFDRSGFGDYQRALKKVRAHHKVPGGDEKKITFEQFAILMCELAKM